MQTGRLRRTVDLKYSSQNVRPKNHSIDIFVLENQLKPRLWPLATAVIGDSNRARFKGQDSVILARQGSSDVIHYAGKLGIRTRIFKFCDWLSISKAFISFILVGSQAEVRNR